MADRCIAVCSLSVMNHVLCVGSESGTGQYSSARQASYA